MSQKTGTSKTACVLSCLLKLAYSGWPKSTRKGSIESGWNNSPSTPKVARVLFNCRIVCSLIHMGKRGFSGLAWGFLPLFLAENPAAGCRSRMRGLVGGVQQDDRPKPPGESHCSAKNSSAAVLGGAFVGYPHRPETEVECPLEETRSVSLLDEI